MLSSSIPKKFPIPWANSAGAAYIRPIPQASQIGVQDGAASLTDGFPPKSLTAILAGGVPPFGQDANGILQQITQWNQWQQAGGAVPYDAAFAASIGGYPKGAMVAAAGLVGAYWVSQVDNNLTNPDAGGANWFGFPNMVNVKTYGAKGDGSTNDSAAFQAAVNYLSSIGGGTLYIPPGFYYATGVATDQTHPIRFIGSGVFGTGLTALGSDSQTILTLNASWSTLENLYIRGYGSDAATTFGANTINPAVLVGANGVSVKIDHCYITGGFNPLKVTAPDVRIHDTYMAACHGGAHCLIIGVGTAGVRLDGCSVDLSFPVGNPTNLAGLGAVPAWATNTSYNVGDIVTNQSYILQCSVAGTSKATGSGPTLLNYGQNITDAGSLVWLLASRVGLFGLQVDTGAQEVYASKLDISGGVFEGCVGITNTQGNTAPFFVHLTDCICGGSLNFGIFCQAGNRVTVTGCELSAPSLKQGVGVFLSGSWTGQAQITNNYIDGNSAQSSVGIQISAGANTIITSNIITNNAGGVGVSSGITDFVISNNIIDCTSSITVSTGASDYYNITNNIVHGTAVSDGGSGSHKTVTGNN